MTSAMRLVMALSFASCVSVFAVPITQQNVYQSIYERSLAIQTQLANSQVPHMTKNQGTVVSRTSPPKHSTKPRSVPAINEPFLLPVRHEPPISMPVIGETHSKLSDSKAGLRLNSSCPRNWKAPWQVGIVRTVAANDGKRQYGCGGVLVHEHWVLTAAHCVENATKVQVMVGSENFFDIFSYHSNKGQVIDVENVTIHEHYRQRIKKQPPLHDIALLRLNSSVEFGLDVAAARIPKRRPNITLLLPGTEMFISGWGNTERSPVIQRQLRCARVPFVSHQTCANTYKKLKVNIRGSHVCSGYPDGGAGPCNGDSGGGLMHRESDGSDTVIGIISWTLPPRCGRHYAVYTSVQTHRPWLLEKAPELAYSEMEQLKNE